LGKRLRHSVGHIGTAHLNGPHQRPEGKFRVSRFVLCNHGQRDTHGSVFGVRKLLGSNDRRNGFTYRPFPRHTRRKIRKVRRHDHVAIKWESSWFDHMPRISTRQRQAQLCMTNLVERCVMRGCDQLGRGPNGQEFQGKPSKRRDRGVFE
jgi:hypothetical protein